MQAQLLYLSQSSPAHRASTSQIADERCAPSAKRIPISRVRCVTTNDITPYKPTSDSSNASVLKLLDSVASMCSVLSDRFT